MLVSCAARLGSSDPRRSSSSTKVLKALVDAWWLTPAEQLAEAILDRTAAYDHVSFAELAQAWPEHFDPRNARDDPPKQFAPASVDGWIPVRRR
jgi:hypothetical protein